MSSVCEVTTISGLGSVFPVAWMNSGFWSTGSQKGRKSVRGVARRARVRKSALPLPLAPANHTGPYFELVLGGTEMLRSERQ